MKKTKKTAGRAGDSLDEALGMMQWSLAQRMEFEFQNYLWHRLLQVIPAPLHGSVMADHFRVQPEKRFQEWRIFAAVVKWPTGSISSPRPWKTSCAGCGLTRAT